MLKFNKNQKRLPIGGYHFPSHGTTFRADTLDGLVKKIKDFRTTNAIGAGAPEQEVLIFYAKHWPYMVMEDRDPPPPKITQEEYAQWRDWIQSTWTKPPNKTLTSKEAKSRWEVCQKCPFNKQLKWEGTDESAELTRRAFILRRGLEVPLNLGFCSRHRWDLSVAVWIDQATGFSAEPNHQKRPDCWVGSLVEPLALRG